ncbi:MAG: hypothetical protein NVS2B3_04170 [Vulcanimicrobiaceae bacterium]
MPTYNRRSALLGATAASVVALATTRAARADATMAMDGATAKETTVAPGVVMRAYGENPAIIAGYKTVRLVDFVMAPGSKTGTDPMPNPMVCHMLDGELRVVQNGTQTIRKTNDVWTCTTGTYEQAFNDSKAPATMRMTFLIPA